MILLYSARDLIDAQLLAHDLERAGIEFVIRNSDLQGALGELPPSMRPEICILRERDWEQANAIKAEFERNHASPIEGAERLCPACGELSPPNFELCWSCRQPL